MTLAARIAAGTTRPDDRVIVLSRRPGQLRLDLEVDLPRPRDEEIRYTAQFGHLAHAVREAIE